MHGPVLSFVRHENDRLTRLSPWFPFVLFSRESLARADRNRIRLEGDDLVIFCTNGGARYRLGTEDALGRHGRLVESW
mgnify:CR=1 FL=1